MASLSAFTEEMLNSTQIEAILREVLAHDLTALLDTALLTQRLPAQPGPPVCGTVQPRSPQSATTPLSEAMIADLKGLAAAVSTGNPDARVVYIANPAQAMRINLTAPTNRTNVIVSGYQAAGSVGAVDGNAIAMLVSQPSFQLSRNASLHMENTSPLPLVSGTRNPQRWRRSPRRCEHVPRRCYRVEVHVALRLGEKAHGMHGTHYGGDMVKRHAYGF